MGDEIEQLRARGLVWHYTTLDALQLILQGRTLLATEVSYQNDPREPQTASDLITEALTQMKEISVHARFADQALRWYDEWRSANGYLRGNAGSLISNSRFIFCASTDPDNLYAWRTYAAGSRSGCAIGLDPTVPLGRIGNPELERHASATAWTQVIYDSDQQLDFAVQELTKVSTAWNEVARLGDESIARQIRDGVPEQDVLYTHHPMSVMIVEFADVVAAITAVAKHPSFHDEHEVRLTVADVTTGIVFSPGANGPRPRIPLTTADRWGEVRSAPAGRLPIRAIVLAPNAHREAATTAQWLLYANGYPLDPEEGIDETGPEPVLWRDPSAVVTVHNSTHPYREV